MSIQSIAKRLGIAKKTERQQAEDAARKRRQRFLEAIANDYHGRAVDESAVNDYLATVEAPERELTRAQSEYAGSVEQAALQEEKRSLEEKLAGLTGEAAELTQQTTWKDGLVLESGPLAQAAMRARLVIDKHPNNSTVEMYRDWRSKLRTYEDACDKLALVNQEVKKTKTEIATLAKKIDASHTKGLGAATVVS